MRTELGLQLALVLASSATICFGQSGPESVCLHSDCFTKVSGGDRCGTDLLNFYASTMARAIRDFTTVLLDIDFWNSRHTPGYSSFNTTTSINNETLTDELMTFVNPQVLSRWTVGSVVTTIIDQVNNISAFSVKQLSPPEFVCPIACSYQEVMMTALFAASITLNCLMVVGFTIYLCSQGRAWRKHKRLSNASLTVN